MASTENVAGAPTPLRILYVITKANWGGAQRYVFDLALASKNAGHEVLVICGQEGVLTERLAEADIQTSTIDAMKRDIGILDEIRSFRSLLTYIGAFRPDVIHANSSKAGALTTLAGRMKGVRRILFTAHGWAFNEGRPLWQKMIIGFLHYVTVLLSHTTICVSSAIRADASWMPFTKKRFALIHNGVRALDFLPRETARAVIAPDLAHTFPDSLWIGTIAELHPTKGLDVLIEAFTSFVRATGSPAVLVIMGEGDDWAHLEKLVMIYDLPDRIVLTGFVKDAATHLKALDLFALPSRSEALGYALLEAGLASLPAIGTRVGGIPEILTDKETGLLVPASDAMELEDALNTMATDETLRTRLGTALHEKVVADFSVETMISKTLALYV